MPIPASQSAWACNAERRKPEIPNSKPENPEVAQGLCQVAGLERLIAGPGTAQFERAPGAESIAKGSSASHV